MVKITGSTPLCSYCFGYIGTLITEIWGKWCCKRMLKNAYAFICFLPQARIWALWISHYRLLLKKFIMGCVRKPVGWIGEDKMLESTGLLEKKNSVCQKLPREKAHVHSVCNFCTDKLSVCTLQEPTMVQVKLLTRSCLSSPASTNLKGLQLFLHGMELRNSLGWASSFPGLCSYNWKHWKTRYTDA